MTPRVTEQFTVSSPRYNNEEGTRGEPEIKVIDFLVSGSESIKLLSRSLPSLVDWGVYLNVKKGVGTDVYCRLFRSLKKKENK